MMEIIKEEDMENMKKFGVIVLTIYVTLVTIAAALFGSLYFLN